MERIGNVDTMQLLLVVILLLCGYFYLFQAVARRSANRAAIPLLAFFLLAIYLMIALPLVWIIGQMGGLSFVFLALLILAACVGLFAAVYSLSRNFRRVNKTMLVLFLLYMLMLSYVTVFSRRGRVVTDVLLRFDSIQEAINRRSLAPLQHLWLNIVMFVPVGLLFTAIDPPRTDRVSVILPLGMLLTTAIETTQLLFHIGQCDLEDLVANTLGALVGLLIYRLYRRMTRPRDED